MPILFAISAAFNVLLLIAWAVACDAYKVADSRRKEHWELIEKLLRESDSRQEAENARWRQRVGELLDE